MAFVYPDRLPFGRAVPPSVFEERRRALAARLVRAGFASALVTGRYDEYGDLAYLTNHVPPYGETAHLLLLHDARATLFARSWREDLVCVDQVESPAALTPGPEPRAHLGLDRVRDHARLLADRSVKHPAEVELLREAAAVSAIGLEAALATVLPEATEKHVAAAAVAAALRAGADECRCRVRLDRHPGPDGWPDATDRLLAPMRPVAIELTGAHQGYRFRTARTVVVGRAPGEEVLARFTVCAESMRAALLPGVDAELARRRLLELVVAAGLEADPDFGGGIGLDIVEPPLLQPGTSDRLELGQTVCLRLCAGSMVHADMVLIQAAGAQRLSTLTPP